MLTSSTNAGMFGNCSLLEADDGLTALEVLRNEILNERKVDVVLMDYVMIKMNGPETVKKMREELGFVGLVVGITGNALPDDLAYYQSQGANCVITKPLTNDKLVQAMRGCA